MFSEKNVTKSLLTLLLQPLTPGNAMHGAMSDGGSG